MTIPRKIGILFTVMWTLAMIFVVYTMSTSLKAPPTFDAKLGLIMRHGLGFGIFFLILWVIIKAMIVHRGKDS